MSMYALVVCALVAGVPLVAMLTLLRRRMLPVVVMRGWFLLTVVANVLLASLVCYPVDMLSFVGVPSAMTQRICIFACCVFFKLVYHLNPQIRITTRYESCSRADVCSTIPCADVLNHTSFWDVFCYIAVQPFFALLETRTLMKSSLRQIPIFGGVFDRVGHFPVYFKSSEDGNFQVDKVRQATVQARVEQHLQRGGKIAVFPEGSVNKRNPRVLLPFRHGTFQIVLAHQLPLFCYTTVGNDVTWPPRCIVGGFPADIVVHVRRVDIKTLVESDAESRSDTTVGDRAVPTDVEPRMVAEGVQAVMQAQLDALFTEQDGCAAKPKAT